MIGAGTKELFKNTEWPTIGVAALIYTGFGLLTWNYHLLPWWLVLPLGGYLVAWHGSLQHEVVHGHPTRWRRINEALVLPSLWLWIPFGLYRKAHLRHHRNSCLTDPLEDPESYYVPAARWAAMRSVTRALLLAHNTLLGRMLLGPPLCVLRLATREISRVLGGHRSHLKYWAGHLPACALVLVWVVGVCGVPLLDYLVFFVYPGIALTLVRSFAEHQARTAVAERSVLVDAGPVMSLLFLNNNLHAVHHAAPDLAWYRLPAVYRARRTELLAENGGYHFRGYIEVFLRYLLWPKEPVRHPLHS